MIFAALSTSCLQHYSTISLNKDGSGTITEKMILGDQMVAMMMQFAEDGDDPIADMVAQTKDGSQEKLKAMGEGVTLKEVKAVNEGGKKGVAVVYAFEDINKLKYAFGQGLSNGEGPEGEEEKNDPISFSYKDGELTILNQFKPDPNDQQEVDEPAADDQNMAMAKQMLRDMRISLALEFPGGIAKTNAEYVEGNVVTIADIKMEALLEDEEKFKAFSNKPGSLAEMREVIKGLDGIRMDTNEKLSVKLK